MSTSFSFIPVPRRSFQFSPMLDGLLYTGVISWNVFGQRWYLSIYGGPGNTRIFTRPLIETSALIGIDEASYDNDTGLVTLTTDTSLNLPIGSCPELTVTGMLPTAYNGTYEMVVQTAYTLTYPLDSDPGGVALAGSIGRLVNLGAGYFNSTIIYQNGNITVS